MDRISDSEPGHTGRTDKDGWALQPRSVSRWWGNAAAIAGAVVLAVITSAAVEWAVNGAHFIVILFGG